MRLEHHKSDERPEDGQDIYDALLEAKVLSEAIHQWQTNGKTWEQAGQGYADQIIQAIRPMMLQTVKRIKGEMFSDLPPFIIKTLVRWVLNSPEYKRDFMRLLTQASDPANWQTPGSTGRALRGFMESHELIVSRRAIKKDMAA